jgi:hypothetical protein
MASVKLTALLSFLLAAIRVAADDDVYIDGAIENTFQDWSWSSTINYAATDLMEGSSSISVTSGAYSALSLYDTTVFSSYAGLKFDFAVCTIQGFLRCNLCSHSTWSIG